jgi:hypothetical protein
MTGPDDEFDDFLARRKPVFRRSTEDPFEPPEELDRIVLRQARDAIERDRPERLYHGPRWGMPVALAATLLLVFTVVLHLGVQNEAPVPEVTVQTINQQIEYPAAAPQPMGEAPAEVNRENSAAAEAVTPMVDLRAPTSRSRGDLGRAPGGFASEGEGTRYAPAPPPPPVASAPARADQSPQSGDLRHSTAAAPPVVVSAPPPSEAERAVASGSSTPAWRQDAATWLAEIERLRAEGKVAEADAEQAEFKRQHRAYAVSPDR